MTLWQQAIDTSRFIAQPADMITLSQLAWLADGDRKQEELIRTYREYYEGDHPTQLTDRMRKFLEIKAHIKFDLNFVPIVVDTLAERFTVVGFAAEAQGGRFENEDDRGNVLVDWWNRNRMDGLQNSVHTSMLRDGDSYVIVEWDADNGRPRFTHEMAYDGNQGLRVHYSNERAGVISYAVKQWPIDEGMGRGVSRRANVYWPNRIEKYYTDKSGNWRPFIDSADGQWPTPWVDSAGDPLGVAVVHFAYNRGGYDFGKSRVHDMIPVNNALNKAVIDELAAADVEGFGLITLSGDDPGDLGVATRSILYAPNPDARWGHIPAGDLSNVSGVVDAWIRRAAQISRTPLNYFQVTGQVAAADTQQADESVLTSAAQKAAVDLGNSWEDCMIMARKLYNTFGPGGLDEDVPISAIFAPLARVDELGTESKRADIVKSLTDSGVALEGALHAAGYDDDMITVMLRGDMVDGITQDGSHLIGDGDITALNGAQIRAALDLMSAVAAGETSEVVAAELLISLGISAERAQNMIASAKRDGVAPADGIEQ